MGANSFKGGVHPYDGKALSKDKPIVELLPKKDLVFPLCQHIGAPANPIVTVGERVLAGQKIGEAGGFVSAPVYSSVSGTVKAIEPHLVANGCTINSIVIENDHQYEHVTYHSVSSVEELSKEEILKRIQEAGLVGMGGAGFPTHVKLSPKDADKIEFIIANCAECEPYITSDYRKMLEEPERLIGGMKVILSLFDHAQGIIAIEDNKPDCIELLTKLVADEPKIKVMGLPTKYPQGSERQLIYATTRRSINSKMLPADAGCIVNNTETIMDLYTAVSEGRPVIDDVITVTGDAIQNPQNFRVLVGTSCDELIEAAGGFKVQPQKIISGGPMMGFAMFQTDVPITKTGSCILCMTKDEVAQYETTACINCGRCVEVCPSNLVPSRLAKCSEHDQLTQFEKLDGIECIECGCCSYVCPAKKHLAQSIRSMRKIALANRKK